jgi:hypothetical protein
MGRRVTGRLTRPTVYACLLYPPPPAGEGDRPKDGGGGTASWRHADASLPPPRPLHHARSMRRLRKLACGAWSPSPVSRGRMRIVGWVEPEARPIIVKRAAWFRCDGFRSAQPILRAWRSRPWARNAGFRVVAPLQAASMRSSGESWALASSSSIPTMRPFAS